MKKEHRENKPEVEVRQEEGELSLQGECVLRWCVSWPQCRGGGKGTERINRFYRRHAELWRQRWKREMYTRACLDLAQRRQEGRPFRIWDMKLITQITYLKEGMLSLWQQAEEVWGFERPMLLRTGDTWLLREGVPCTLGSFFSGQRRWKSGMMQQLEQQAEQRLASGMSLLDPECVHRVKTKFSEHRFYLTQNGIEVFYPMYLLGAGAERIPVFSVPTS